MHNIDIYRIKIDLNKIGDGYCLSPKIMKNILSDGRNSSALTEHWASIIYSLSLSSNKSQPYYDASNQACSVSVKTFTAKGTAVRRSKNTGIGRKCTIDDVIDALKGTSVFVFCMINKLPYIYFVKIDSSILMDWVNKKIIGKSGMISHKKFEKALKEEFKSITYYDFNIITKTKTIITDTRYDITSN